MNENPGEAPAQPTQPVTPEPSQPAEPVAVAPAAEQTPAATVPEQASAAPTAEQAPAAPAPEQKKKTGLIVGIIVLAVLLCAGVAVALLYPFGGGNGGGGQKGRVKNAVVALFDENAPTNVGMDGKITITTDAEDSPVTDASITFQSKYNTKSNVNTTEAVISLSLSSGTNFAINVDELYTEDGELYLKLDNLTDSINSYQVNTNPGLVDCSDYSDATDCVQEDDSISEIFDALSAFGIVDMVDGKWIRVSFDDLADSFDLEIDTNPIECLNDVLGDDSEIRKDLAANYESNPFILESTDNLGITKKKNDLYRLSIDTAALNSFSSALESSEYIEDLYDCLGTVKSDSNQTISSSTIENLPVTYVEIDSNNRFTRLYMEGSDSNNTYSIKADIDLSYPTSITITEPSEYVDFQEILVKLFGGFQGGLF